MADLITMKSTEKVSYTISGFWADEAQTIPAKIDGQPVATITEGAGTGATLNEAADGMSGEVVGVDMPDDAPAVMVTLEIKADANRDPVIQDFIKFTKQIAVSGPTGPVATNFGVTFGTPVPK